MLNDVRFLLYQNQIWHPVMSRMEAKTYDLPENRTMLYTRDYGEM